MGHKKRNSAQRSKPSAAESVSKEEPRLVLLSGKNGVASKAESKALKSSASPFVSVKTECERALTALRRGNHTKALRLMKEMSSKHENSPHSALVHRVQGTVFVKVAALIDDPNTKQRHLKNAIENARKAVMLSPNSIEFSHFYANLLYEVSNEAKEYEEVIQECERALAIENPVDPAKESLQDESQQKLAPAEARIAHVHAELRALINKSNISSISSWMKNLGGNGEEKFRLIPVRRLPEDPMELRFVQNKRPNEIKKVIKTSEEKRQEIEVQVAAARVLQHQSKILMIQNDANDADKGLDSSSGMGQRLGERRKSGNVRKSATSAERKESVRLFWNSLSLDIKKELLNVRVSDLKSHFSSSKDRLAHDVISEALSFAEGNNDWKFWSCCRCSKKFPDGESHTQHVMQEHLGTLLPKMQSVLPKSIENEWAEMLINCEWKPIDFNAAIKIIREQSKIHDSARNGSVDAIECFGNSFCNEDGWDSMPRNKESGDSCNGITTKSREYEKISNIVWMDCDENQECKSLFPPESWPLSDDTERANFLEKIYTLLDALVKNKYIASSHLNKVLHFAVEELRGQAFGSQLLKYNKLLKYNIDKTPLCICFLDAPELKKILKYVQDLYHFSGLGGYNDKNNNVLVDVCIATTCVKSLEKLVLSEDASYLSLYEHFLPQKHFPADEGTIDDSTHVGLPDISTENGILLDSDALLSWIFMGPSSGEQVASWTQMKGEKTHQGTEVLQFLEKDFFALQNLCERKLEHLSFEEALQGVEDLCLEEGKKRENMTEFVRRSYESVLRKHREELYECNKNAAIINRFEVDAISNVLKDAESLNTNQFAFEETYGGMISHLSDLESGEDGDWRTKDYLHQVDSCVEVAIQRQKEHVSDELSKIDVQILWTVARMQRLEFKLESVSTYDYRTILVPLVKSYMRSHLEYLVEKDATEKSDAAREAFLAELARDAKKGAGTGSDHVKHVQEKTKDKKKNKENRKAKDSKANSSTELHTIDCETNEEASFLVPYESEGLDCDIANAVIGDSLGEQEWESRRRLELEAEERKLEETLEYQRRIENEAKQKHLAEQHKRTMKKSTEKVEANILPADGDEEEHVVQKNGIPVILGGFPEKTDEVILPKIGLPDGGSLENGFSLSERRTGRKSRRQKGAARSNEGKPQSLSSEKENIEVDPLRSLEESHDNGTKTLRQLQAEEDDEERFLADLKKAVRQSLDSFIAEQKSPLGANKGKLQKLYPEMGNSVVLPDEVITSDIDGVDVYGTGLRNEVGEYNCFLNVIIQSLWHLRQFRDEFLSRSSSEHVHVGDPCVICALYEIFAALSTPSVDSRREAVAPTCLRIALSNHCPNSNFFQEGQMNDASEVLEVIFKCLHQSFNSVLCISDAESVDGSPMGSWDCTNSTCIAHSLFGMDIFEIMNCSECHLQSRHMKYTSFFHNINASALRTMKVMCPESSFDELLSFVEINHQLACDKEMGGCGKHNYIHHFLFNPPHVFTTVLGWQNTCEDVNDIKATLEALSTEIDVSLLYRGLDPKYRYRLVSVVCYYGQHYHCFAYSHDHERWVMYDDKTVKVIGSWEEVVIMCEKGHLQPQVLFFEAVN